MKKFLLLALLLIPVSADAARPDMVFTQDVSINTLSTTSATVIQPNANRVNLTIHNPSASYKVACSLVGTTAVINGYGSITLLPGSTYTLEGTTILRNGFNCISENAAATGLTVWEG